MDRAKAIAVLMAQMLVLGKGYPSYRDAMETAIAALREQEQREHGCYYCDIAKANEGVANTSLWVKEAETNKWTMMGKRLEFCPMCGRKLKEGAEG